MMRPGGRRAITEQPPAVLGEVAERADAPMHHVLVNLLVEIRKEVTATREELSEARQQIAEIRARQSARKGKRPKIASHEPTEEGKNKQAFDVADIPYYWSIPAAQVKELRERGELPEAFFSQKSRVVLREDIERTIRSRLTIPESMENATKMRRGGCRSGTGGLTTDQLDEQEAAEAAFRRFEGEL